MTNEKSNWRDLVVGDPEPELQGRAIVKDYGNGLIIKDETDLCCPKCGSYQLTRRSIRFNNTWIPGGENCYNCGYNA